MTHLLIIDTATTGASVILTQDGQVLKSLYSDDFKDHAAFLQPAISRVIKSAAITINQLAAVAVINGPGSYTGLRVGLASAKGLCFALNIPLITIGTLEAMVHSAIHTQKFAGQDVWYCPMIDARRMEVFTGLFNSLGDPQTVAGAMILDESSFKGHTQDKTIIFFGNGADKFKNIHPQPNALFENFNVSPDNLAQMAHKLYDNQSFSDIAYTEPNYLKAFFSTQKRQAE